MIRIQTEDFDLSRELAALREGSGNTGAIVTFTGLVREDAEGEKLSGMYLEHYPGMTEAAIQQILDEASERWQLEGVRVIHRVGNLSPGDQIVLVATSSSHREAAFAGAEFIMDYLKTRAPFWKKERLANTERWIGTRKRDEVAADRWST